ncbi:hypothetical protein [Streptomyces sp. NPDC059411]|uniref:hypothetical protein n=1 Tax=Streptomyces sp. NPDC059411 TaxID=3346825 RepID=UPI0036B923EC
MSHIDVDHGRPENIPALAPDAHHTIDWDRVRATVRALRPVRTLPLMCAAMLPAVVWAERVAAPVSTERSVDTAFAIAFVTSMVCAVGMATGGRIRRWTSAVLLFAVVGGTLISAPTRNLIVSWIVGA